MNSPTIWVLMANYNHGCFVGEALRAILPQSRKPGEVIVLDDASTDDGVEVITAIMPDEPAVRLVRNERNAGVVAAVDKMLAAATCDYLHGAVADDKVLPGLCETSLRLPADLPQAALCCSDPAHFDGATGEERIERLGRSAAPAYLPPGDLSRAIREKGASSTVTPRCSRHRSSRKPADWMPGPDDIATGTFSICSDSDMAYATCRSRGRP